MVDLRHWLRGCANPAKASEVHDRGGQRGTVGWLSPSFALIVNFLPEFDIIT
jgi:hypothetical protein